MSRRLTARTARGAAALGGAQAIRYGVSFLALPVLARLITPDEFGVASMTLATATVLVAINDLGFLQALVRMRQRSRTAWSTAFWTNLGFGATLTIATILAAGAIAAVFQEPRIADPLRTNALVVMCFALACVPHARLLRTFRFRAIAGAEAVGSVGGFAVAIIAAYNGAGYWSIVYQSLTLAIVRCGIVIIAAGWRPRLVYRRADLRPLIGVGIQLSSANLLVLANRVVDKIILARFFGAAAVGVYHIAFQAMMIPVEVFQQAGQSLLPRMTQMVDGTDKLGRAYLRVVALLALISLPLFTGAALLAAPLVSVVFGEPWAASALILTCLAPAGAVLILRPATYAALTASGATRTVLLLSTMATLAIAACVYVGARFGLAVGAAGYSVAAVMVFVVGAVTTARRLGMPPWSVPATLAPILACAAAMASGVWIADAALVRASASDIVRLIVCVPLGAFVFALASGVLNRPMLADVRAVAIYLSNGRLRALVGR